MEQKNSACPVNGDQAQYVNISNRQSRSHHRRAEVIDPHDLDMTAYRSSALVRGRNAIIRIDEDMRRNYATLKSELINQLSPVIVVNNDAKGGEYTLIFNGEKEKIHPIPVVFELAKSIAHIPLGIYSIIAPYLRGSDTSEWKSGLSEFSNSLQAANHRLRDVCLPNGLELSCRKIIEAGIQYINTSINSGKLSIQTFRNFSASISESIHNNMWFAANAQISGVRQLLTRWQNKIGCKEWENLYVVVLSMWTTSVMNQNSIIIREFMDAKRVDTHLIDIPTAQTPEDYLYVALDNLARIVQDNVAAEMIFPADQNLADALKGTQDLLSDMILDQLHNGERVNCPV